MSFAFRVGEEEWGDGRRRRTAHDPHFDEIFDVSARDLPGLPRNGRLAPRRLALEAVDPASSTRSVRAGIRAGMEPRTRHHREYLRILRFLIDPPPREMATSKHRRTAHRGGAYRN